MPAATQARVKIDNQKTRTGRTGRTGKAERPSECPFRAGEMLTYDVSYSTYVTAGTVTMQVQAKRPSYNWLPIVSAKRGDAPPSSLDAYDKLDVLMDVHTLLPQRRLYSEEGQRHQMKVTHRQRARKATSRTSPARAASGSSRCRRSRRMRYPRLDATRALP